MQEILKDRCDKCSEKQNCKQYKRAEYPKYCFLYGEKEMTKENKKEEVKEQMQPENALNELIKVAFKDGFTSAFAFIEDQFRLVKEQGILDKITGNYVTLFLNKVQEEQEKALNETGKDNNVGK